MYKVVDLLKDPVEAFYYRQQLTKSDAPKDSDYFFVEKILGKKKIKGVVHYLIKYLYYPNKFNSYVPASSFRSQLFSLLFQRSYSLLEI